MSTVDEVSRQMKEALRAKEPQRLAALRSIRAAFLNEMKKDGSDSLPEEVCIALLRKLEHAVHQAVRHSTTGKVTLVGHSAGGVMARLYLSPKPFLGHAYRGLDYVDHLITLGSPHYNQRGGQMRRWVDEQYPGTYFAPQVEYTSVAGKAIRGNRRGSFRGRWAYRFYERLSGAGNAWGDGLVSAASALLRESQQITLEGVSHFTGFGGPWYGTAEVVPQWWDACKSRDEREGKH